MSAIGRFLSAKKSCKAFRTLYSQKSVCICHEPDTRRKGICHESDTHRKDSVATARNT